MKKNSISRLMALLLLSLLPLGVQAQHKEIHILSANDMHAAIEAFPQLADVADSLRALYPDLLIFSAGDNRTGDPLNDMYEIPAYPMVALMNQIGFNATTLGNHEFDSNAYGLGRLTTLSAFSYICANIEADPSLGIHTVPCKVFDVSGTRVGVVGLVQLGIHGTPDTHPDNCCGVVFKPYLETVQQYEWLRQQCDVVILLTHIGYEADVALAEELPWVDLIIGGHTHTQIDGGETHANNILITQNINRLKMVTHTTLVMEGDSIASKQAELIDVRAHEGKNKVVETMVRYFSDNPAFQRRLTYVEAPFSCYEELGCMMCDAFVHETGADVGIENAGGVRYYKHPVGPFTVADVLRLDPFENEAVELNLTGEELRQLLLSCCNNDADAFPFVSGIICEVVSDKDNPDKVVDVVLYTPDEQKLDLKKTYRVVTNSYVPAISDSPRKDKGRLINRKTTDLIIDFLDHQPSINYQGVSRIRKVKR